MHDFVQISSEIKQCFLWLLFRAIVRSIWWVSSIRTSRSCGLQTQGYRSKEFNFPFSNLNELSKSAKLRWMFAFIDNNETNTSTQYSFLIEWQENETIPTPELDILSMRSTTDRFYATIKDRGTVVLETTFVQRKFSWRCRILRYSSSRKNWILPVHNQLSSTAVSHSSRYAPEVSKFHQGTTKECGEEFNLNRRNQTRGI